VCICRYADRRWSPPRKPDSYYSPAACRTVQVTPCLGSADGLRCIFWAAQMACVAYFAGGPPSLDGLPVLSIAAPVYRTQSTGLYCRVQGALHGDLFVARAAQLAVRSYFSNGTRSTAASMITTHLIAVLGGVHVGLAVALLLSASMDRTSRQGVSLAVGAALVLHISSVFRVPGETHRPTTTLQYLTYIYGL
jgi:hypothetical protein